MDSCTRSEAKEKYCWLSMASSSGWNKCLVDRCMAWVWLINGQTETDAARGKCQAGGK